MSTNAADGHDEIDDDEATLAASSDAIKEIRAQAARVRSDQAGFDPSEDPTTVMVDGALSSLEDQNLDPGLVEEPTIINFKAAEDVTVIKSFDAAGDLTTGSSDPREDPTTPMSKPVEPADSAVAGSAVAEPRVWTPSDPSTTTASSNGSSMTGSLIGSSAAPASSTSYWDRDETTDAVGLLGTTGKGPVPKWFIATSLLAVLMAVGLVLLVLWALWGST